MYIYIYIYIYRHEHTRAHTHTYTCINVNKLPPASIKTSYNLDVVGGFVIGNSLLYGILAGNSSSCL